VLIKKIHEEHPLAIIPSGSKDGVDIEVENGCDTGVEIGNVTRNKEALVRERRRIGKGKGVVIEPYDSCDGYPSNDSGLVNNGYVMYENDDIDLNTLVRDDWLGGISFTNTQGQVAHEFATEAITEATNGPELPANGLEEDTNGPDQGANGHPQDGPGPEKGGNRPENAIKAPCLKHGKDIYIYIYIFFFKRNERYKLKVYCKKDPCPWHIYVSAKSSVDKTLVVKIYNLNHNCSRVWKNKQATTKRITDTFIDRVQSNPQIPPKSLLDVAAKEWVVSVSHIKRYRAKRAALQLIEGIMASKYSRLWDYFEEVKRTNL
ncbi:unnamed protein product, partial [Prunus brigantina]